jgi:hypothetical protein
MNTLPSEVMRLVQFAFADHMRQMFPDANARAEEVEILEGSRHPLLGIHCLCVWRQPPGGFEFLAHFFWW